MSLFEQNMQVLKETNKELYEKLLQDAEIRMDTNILVGDALDGEKFLAYQQGKTVIAINSMYSPAHETERYMAQFEPILDSSSFLVFGLGNGQVIDQILAEEEKIVFCTIWEPSVQIMKKALEEYDLTSILGSDCVRLLVGDIDRNKLETELSEMVTYDGWKRFQLCVLNKYDQIYEKECTEIIEIYHRVVFAKEAELNTLIRFAKSGMENEVYTMKWLMNCVPYQFLKKEVSCDVPYIVVAAGPSLEKNVEQLKRAKGKAIIICVDTAIGFLLNHDVTPDIICCVDAQKELCLFENPKIAEIPIVVSTDTNYKVLEKMGDCKPIYVSISNDFLEKEFAKQGINIGYFDGGGSVATVCFQMGVTLGFKRIILVGQDLAFTEDKVHAGMGKYNKDDLVYGFSVVEGYNGGQVTTRNDLKNYLEWYNARIPQLQDCEVINATEGGAKITGTIQMPLAEAIDKYCVKECQVAEILKQTKSVWETKEERQSLYDDIEKQYRYFKGFRRRLKEAISSTERGILLLERGGYQKKELQKIDNVLASITREVEEKTGILILIKRMIDTEASMTDDLHEVAENTEKESIRLYKKMHKYLLDMLEADEELLPMWKEVMDEIRMKYME